jgi:hypothetical protein
MTEFGTVNKRNSCERCGHDYAYRMTRRASGDARLRRELERDCDPVPCPSCGWYQTQMVTYLRHQRYGRFFRAALIFLPLSLVIFVADVVSNLRRRGSWPPIDELVFYASLVAVAPATLLLLFFLVRNFDPNREDAEARKRLGQARAVPQEELSQILQEEASLREAALQEEARRSEAAVQSEAITAPPQPMPSSPQQSATSDTELPAFEQRDYLDALRENRRAKRMRRQQASEPAPPTDDAGTGG